MAISLINNKKLFLLLGIALFYVIFLLLSDVTKFFSVISKMNFSLLLPILLVHLGAILMRAIRQKILFDSLGIRISVMYNIKIHIASLSLIVTPGTSGELIKSYFLRKSHNSPYSQTIPTVILEKYHDLLAITTILLVVAFFASLVEAHIAISVFVTLLVFGFLFFRNERILLFLSSKIPKKGIFSKLISNVTDYQDSFKVLLRQKVFLKSWVAGTVSWTLDAVVVYLGFLALGVNYSFAYSNLITYTAVVAGALSLIPGGIGITETGMTGLLVKSGLTLATSTAVVVLVRLTTTWFTTLLGMIAIKFVISK